MKLGHLTAFLVLLGSWPVLAGASEVEVRDYSMPGDGSTPTFLQYLDTQNFSAKATADLAAAEAKGDLVYSYDLELPPALLKPSLSLNYSSGARMNLEMPYGWSLGGIAEIRRPTVRAFKTDGRPMEREFLVSGPGFSGTLLPTGTEDFRWIMRASSAVLVTAVYDKSADTWTLHQGGVTWELSPKDAGADTPSGTALWRVDKMIDASGNFATYDYHSDGRIRKISYGGNETTGEEHLVDVEFDYAKNAAERTDARAGFVVTFGHHVTDITVKEYDDTGVAGGIAATAKSAAGALLSGLSGVSSGASKSGAKISSSTDRDIFYLYDLVTTETDGLDLLTKLQREGSKPADVETVATFEYSEFDDSDAAARESAEEPESLGWTEGYTRASSDWTVENARDLYKASRTQDKTVLADFNRDGLPDVIEAGSSWSMKIQKVDHAARTFSWYASASINKLFDYEYLSRTKADPPTNVTEYFAKLRENETTRQTIDVDGDGYLDVIDSNGSDREWTVYYGNGLVYSDGTAEKAPSGWTALQVSYSINADQVNLDEEDGDYVATDEDAIDVVKGLIDLNGDGWLDAYDPATGQACYHGDDRGDGWRDCETIDTFESLRGVTYTIDSRDEEDYAANCWAACKYGCAIDNGCLDYVNAAEEYSQQCSMLTFWECFDAIEEEPCSDDFKSCYETCAESKCDEPRNAAFSTTSDDGDGYQHFITRTNVAESFQDLNGDGLPDHIDASATPWQVALGNGDGFEDAVAWESPKKYSRRTDEGEPKKTNITPKSGFAGNEDDIEKLDEADGQDDDLVTTIEEEGEAAAVIQDLIDVDGDGLPDLALGADLGDKWYKNTGAGFETKSRSLPDWWPDDFMTKITHVTYGKERATETVNAVISAMADLDHDGAVDRVSVCIDTDGDGPEAPTINCKVYYGPYPRPYMLVKIKNGQGGETEIAYRSSATVSPSGDRYKTQYNPVTQDLVDEIATADTLTSQDAETDFSYADGYYEDGVFHGFGARTLAQKINGAETSETEFAYELDRDLAPLVTTQELKTDASLSFAPSLDRGDVSLDTRFEVTDTYEDYGDGVDFFRLLKTRVVKEYGEKSGSKTTTLSYTWDDHANLKIYAHDGGGTSDDAVQVTMHYASDADETFYRMSSKSAAGTDPLDGVYRAVTNERYFYDGNGSNTATLTKGLLSKRQVSAGWPGGGGTLDDEVIDVSFERGDRGEVESVTDEATGVKIAQTFGFGGATLETQTNNLGHQLTRTIDSRGRITSIQDANGLTVTSTFDDFNRVTKKRVTGKDGKSYTDTANDYERSGAPYYVKKTLYGDDGAAESTNYAVEDGFGRIAQAWAQDENGSYYATTEIFDLRGLSTGNSHPKYEGTAFSAPAAFSIAKEFGKTYHDALGVPRETILDAAASSGSQLFTFDSPRVEVRQDEEGYQTKITYDAHHRVIKVQEGAADSYTTTAQYTHDPADRLVKFQDGNGVCYAYYYDGADRLRQVKYGKTSALSAKKTAKVSSALSKTAATSSTCTASKLWYTYEYDGTLKTKMTDAAGAYASWTYDEIGRPKTMTVSDGLPSAPGTLSYAWDYDDAWIGAAYKTTDPSGETIYAYDALGRVKDLSRTYAASAANAAGKTVTFSFANDLRGRVTAKTMPSGRAVGATYKHGFLSENNLTDSGATAYTLYYGYNKWGLLETATSSLGHLFTNTHTTPLWPDEMKMQFGTTARERDYTWYKNGLLKTRTDSVDTGATSYTVIGGVARVSVANAAKGVASALKSSTKASSKTISKTSLAGSVAAAVSASSGSSAGSSLASAASLSGGSIASAAASGTEYTYAYDALKELASVKTTFKTVESFSYDAAGNPKTMQDDSGATWTYAAAGTLNQIASRTSDKGGSESYAYDAAGRLSEWKSADGTYAYYYDGHGRLRGVTLDGKWQTVLDYDADGKLVRRGDANPFESSATPSYVYSFGDWRYDEETATTTEFDNEFVATEKVDSAAAARKWLFREYDGHVAAFLDDAGTLGGTRALGAFGAALSSTGTSWDWHSFHGAEERDSLFHMGQRHLMQKDGQWLQPEPLLYLGLPGDNLTAPLSLATYRYALNSPTRHADPAGMDPVATGVDANVAPQTVMDATNPTMKLMGMLNPDMQNTPLQEASATYQRVLAATGDKSLATLAAGKVLVDATANVNGVGGKTNCTAVSGSAAVTWAGGLASTAGDTKEISSEQFQNAMGLEYFKVDSMAAITTVMELAGPGTQAIVAGERIVGNKREGHQLNVVNIEGNIRFIDRQNGTFAPALNPKAWDDGSFQMMIVPSP